MRVIGCENLSRLVYIIEILKFLSKTTTVCCRRLARSELEIKLLFWSTSWWGVVHSRETSNTSSVSTKTTRVYHLLKNQNFRRSSLRRCEREACRNRRQHPSMVKWPFPLQRKAPRARSLCRLPKMAPKVPMRNEGPYKIIWLENLMQFVFYFFFRWFTKPSPFSLFSTQL